VWLKIFREVIRFLGRRSDAVRASFLLRSVDESMATDTVLGGAGLGPTGS
jgi:hypothetical protein